MPVNGINTLAAQTAAADNYTRTEATQKTSDVYKRNVQLQHTDAKR